MKYLLVPILVLILLFTACNKEDDNDSSCKDFTASWVTSSNNTNVEDQWLFVTDTSGTLIASTTANPGSILDLTTEKCEEQRIDVTHYRLERRQIDVNGEIKEIPFHYVRTYLGVNDNTELTDQDTLPSPLRAFAIEGVSSLESLNWPEEDPAMFNYPIFLNQSDQILSFEVPIGTAQPAFFSIRANGEASTRYIWVENADDSDLSFQYDLLPQLQPQGPVMLPNDQFWIYSIFGIAEFGTSVLAKPVSPALAQDFFGEELPLNTDVSPLRLRAYDFTSLSDGQLLKTFIYDQIVPGLPTEIDIINPEMTLERNLQELKLSVGSTDIDLIELSLTEQETETSRLEWIVYGTPSQLERFIWPQWPEEINALRTDLLLRNTNTPLIVYAKKYNTRPDYESILNAIRTSDELWEAQQGLRVRGRAF